jgi:hypothetical protein
MKINIKKLGGEIELSSPSLATCFEFVSLWSAETDNAMLARLVFVQAQSEYALIILLGYQNTGLLSIALLTMVILVLIDYSNRG